MASGTQGGEDRERQAPRIDVSRASPARVYDLLLGGKDHFASDRDAAAKVLQVAPQVRDAVRENRRFLQRAVRYLAAEAGIRQFIDIGTGLPTVGNVHEVARVITPHARVVYVDNDPIVLVHGRALLADNETTIVIDADARRPEEILGHPDLRALIDFSQPVAVLFVAILHFLTDADDPARVVAAFRDAVAPGSHLVISHATAGKRPATHERAARLYRETTTALTLRNQDQVRALFDGFTLVDPGVVPAARWRPDLPDHTEKAENPAQAPVLAGVGRKEHPRTTAGLPARSTGPSAS